MLPFDLILVTDNGPNLVDRVAAALSGVEPQRVALQLRRKQETSGSLHKLAQALRELTLAHGVSLFINDRVDVARAVDADGVHLPESGLPVEVARRLLGRQCWVGVSRHDLKGLFEAAREGADYATLSPVHAVPGKNPPLGINGFARTIAAVRLPVYALGGVKARDVPELRQAGARGVAVIRAVLGAKDPAREVRELLARLAGERPS